jgi:hypothetical protein
MIQFVENFQEMAHVPCDPVEGDNKHNIKAPTPSIYHQLVEAGSLRLRAANSVGVLADDFIATLLRHLTQVEKLRLQILFHGGNFVHKKRIFSLAVFSSRCVVVLDTFHSSASQSDED